MTVPGRRADDQIDRDKLLSRVALEQVMDAVTHGSGQGRRRRWRCPEPDHPDVHPSVSISIDKRGVERWRCWSGGHGGTAIDAVIATHRMTVGDAIRWLNDQYGHLGPRQPNLLPKARSGPLSDPSPDLIDYVERCEECLWTSSGTDIRGWLTARGLTTDVLVANRVGADPGRGELARRKGLPNGAPAAVFPAFDRSGDISYFQARFIAPGASGPKYANPAQHLAANPRLAWTQPPGPRPSTGPLIVTEGIPDALIAARAGMRSVGVLGSMTPSNLMASHLVKGATDCDPSNPRIVVCFDADQAGRAGADRLVELLHPHTGVSVATVPPPEGMDLTDWAASGADWTDHLCRPQQLATDEPEPEIELASE